MTRNRLVYLYATLSIVFAAISIIFASLAVEDHNKSNRSEYIPPAQSTQGYNFTPITDTLAELLNENEIYFICEPIQNAPKASNGKTATAWVANLSTNTIHFLDTMCEEMSDLTQKIKDDPTNVRNWVVIRTIVHEAIHTKGIGNEAETECYAIQLMPMLSNALGVETETSILGQEIIYARYNYMKIEDYWTPECSKGGQYDIGKIPNTIDFPLENSLNQ